MSSIQLDEGWTPLDSITAGIFALRKTPAGVDVIKRCLSEYLTSNSNAQIPTIEEQEGDNLPFYLE